MTGEILVPDRSGVNEHYWLALDARHLVFQECLSCDKPRLPPRTECPHCLSDAWEWRRASGAAKLISWVVYQTAFHPAFADRLPYTVAVVELIEGPRLISNIVEVDDPETLMIDQDLELVIQHERGTAITRFRPFVRGSSNTHNGVVN
ncbi:MAG: OB-fold domain-containing protein [Betaproteobacteria bacterium]|nr:OB-fold domain-containing protein [Betaproteobacteria bacterium]